MSMICINRSISLLLFSLLSFLHFSQCKVSNVSPFPYEYWKPSTGFTRITTEKPTTKTYNYFYGDPVESPSDVKSWDVLPIKVPKNLMKDVQYRTQYKRRSNGKPLNKKASLKAVAKSKIKQLVRNSWPSRLLSRWTDQAQPYYREPLERSQDFHSDAHEFYPMETADGLTINLLQRDGNHLPYQPGYNPDHVNYNILDYSRYNYPQQTPTIARKKYNENLVDMMTKKVFGNDQKRYNYQTLPKPTNKDSMKDIFYDEFNDHSEPPVTSIYEPSYQYDERDRQPSYQTPPPKSSYTPSERFTSWLKSKTKHLLKDTFRPAETYVPNLPNPFDTTTVKPKHFLYYYNSNHIYDDANHRTSTYPDYEDTPTHSKWSLNGYKKKGSNSILERIASIQQSPSALLLPGGLAAVGMGLALYYFNYVWYPTPVVTAKMSRLILNILDTDIVQDNSDLQKVVEVFRSLEDGHERNADCQKRLVCQLHQEIPGLWEVTSVLSPLVRSNFGNSSEESLKQYLDSAESGRSSSTSCQKLYTSCKSPYTPFRPFLNSIFSGSLGEGDTESKSRVFQR